MTMLRSIGMTMLCSVGMTMLRSVGMTMLCSVGMALRANIMLFVELKNIVAMPVFGKLNYIRQGMCFFINFAEIKSFISFSVQKQHERLGVLNKTIGF